MHGATLKIYYTNLETTRNEMQSSCHLHTIWMPGYTTILICS